MGSNCDPARFSARSMAAPVPPMRWATSTNSPIMPSLDCDGNGLALEVPGPALAVPLLVGGADCLLDTDRQPQLFGQSPGERRVLLDHPVEVTVPRDGELHADPEAVQRWVAASQQPEGRQGSAQGPELVVVLAGLQGDVVAEPLGLLVGIGVAADVDEQGRVVDDRALAPRRGRRIRPGAGRSCTGAVRAPSAGRSPGRRQGTRRPPTRPAVSALNCPSRRRSRCPDYPGPITHVGLRIRQDLPRSAISWWPGRCL